MGLPNEISHSIDEAIEYLRRTRTAAKPDIGSTDTDGLLFLGQWHDAYPTVLVRDPFLSDSATKGGSTGLLLCVAAFSGGDKSADDGDTLNVQYDFSAADDGA